MSVQNQYRMLIGLMAASGSGGGGGYEFVDSDAEAFYIATGLPSDATILFPSTPQEITGAALAEAVDDLVAALKGDSIWTKFVAIYPFIGGTAASHKWNLKDPQDLDAAFRIVWGAGTITHDETGVTGGGATTSIGDTKITPSTHLTEDDTHLSLYSRSSGTSLNPDIGCIATDRLNLAANYFGGTGAITEHYANFLVPGNTAGLGFYVTSRTSNSSLTLYRNGSSIGSNGSADGGTRPNATIWVCGSNGQGASTRPLAFASIGAGLNGTEVSNFNTSVEAFQDALGRGVI